VNTLNNNKNDDDDDNNSNSNNNNNNNNNNTLDADTLKGQCKCDTANILKTWLQPSKPKVTSETQ